MDHRHKKISLNLKAFVFGSTHYKSESESYILGENICILTIWQFAYLYPELIYKELSQLSSKIK